MYREGDLNGQDMFIIIHGHTSALESNEDFIKFRRSFRDNLQEMLTHSEKTLTIENELHKVKKFTK